MGMSWKDEEEIVLMSLVASVILFVSLNTYLGTLYAFLIGLYHMFIKKPFCVQFSTKRKYFNPANFLAALIAFMAWVVISSGLTSMSIASLFSINSMMSFADAVTMNNKFVKLLVWGLFIPLAETLFIFGIVYGFARYKFRSAVIAGIATFAVMLILHTVNATIRASHQLNRQTLIIDGLFVAISVALIEKYKQLKEAFYFHAFINTARMLMLMGLIA